MTTPAPSRRRFLTTTLRSTLGAGLGVATLTACGSSEQSGASAGSGTQPPTSTQPPASVRPAGGEGPELEPPVANGNEVLQRLIEGNRR